MKAIDNTAAALVEKDSDHISITGVVEAIRADSEGQDPVLREVELAAMLRLANLLSNTGIIRIPGVIYGALLSEHERVGKLADEVR